MVLKQVIALCITFDSILISLGPVRDLSKLSKAKKKKEKKREIKIWSSYYNNISLDLHPTSGETKTNDNISQVISLISSETKAKM